MHIESIWTLIYGLPAVKRLTVLRSLMMGSSNKPLALPPVVIKIGYLMSRV